MFGKKNSWNNWCTYRVQLVLPFFFCTPPSMRNSLFVLASYLPLFVGKNAINCACSVGHRCFFSHSSSQAWLAPHGRFLLASVWPKKRWKIAPVQQIQASSMKLRVHGFLSLVFLHIKTDYWAKIINNTSLKNCCFLSFMCKYLLIVLRMFIHSLILILMITSQAIHYSQNVFRGFLSWCA